MQVKVVDAAGAGVEGGGLALLLSAEKMGETENIEDLREQGDHPLGHYHELAKGTHNDA